MVSLVTFPIATLDVDSGGRIGVCPLPGGNGNITGDLETVFAWNPAIVLSMTEQKEMNACDIGDLGARLQQQGIDWVHLPVRDLGGLAQEDAHLWPDLSRRLHKLMDQGKGVLLHCRGGKGRSGMIALRLMIERGEYPDMALLRLRTERPGAVETEEQQQWAIEPAAKNNN